MTPLNSCASQLPGYLILDTEAIVPLMNWMCECFVEDPDVIYQELVHCLADERDAEYEVNYFARLYEQCNPDSEPFTHVFSQVADKIFQQIKAYRLYKNHQLPYEFDRMVGDSMVLSLVSDDSVVRLRYLMDSEGQYESVLPIVAVS